MDGKAFRGIRITFLAAVLAVAPAGAESVNVSLGADSQFLANFDLASGLPDGAADGAASLTPMLNLSMNLLDARASFSAVLGRDGETGFSLEESYLKVYPFDGLLIACGRYAVNPGRARFLPLLSLLAPADVLSVLGGMAALPLSDQVEFRFIAPAFHAGIAWRPPFFPCEFSAPDVDGPWFPSASIPESISDGGISATRRAIEIGSALGLDDRRSGDWLVDLGASIAAFDFGLVAYWGIAPKPAYVPRLVFGEALDGGSYTVEIDPVFARIGALGFYLSFAPDLASLGGMEVHLEGRYSTGVPYEYETGRIGLSYHEGSWSVLVADSSTTEEVACCLGGSLSLQSLPLSFFFEGKTEFFPTESDIDVAFSNLALGGIQGRLFRDSFAWNLAAAVSLPDGGWALFGQMTIKAWGESELSLAMPIFFGNPDSDLGQYSGVKRLCVTFSAKT